MSKSAQWTVDLRQRAAIAGALLLAISAGLMFVEGKDQFFRSYLIGFIFCLGIAFGALGLQMIHALTGGRWGPPARPTLYAASSTMPLFVLLFAPLVLGMQSLYPWSTPEALNDHIIQHKVAYLNAPFWIARGFGCLVLWSALALVLYNRSVKRGLAGPSSAAMRIISGPGLLVGALTMSVAAIDWLMSLDPHWFSTMFGVIVIVGMLLSAQCFVIALLILEKSRQGNAVPIDELHDLGNLLLVFVMLWAYVSYSQYLIIYSGNMAEDVPWYFYRSAGGWQYLSLGLIIFHFAVPFLILVSRRSKRSPQILGRLALALLALRLLEIFWLVAPNFYRHDVRVSMLDVVLPLGLCGLWLAVFFHRRGVEELQAQARAA